MKNPFGTAAHPKTVTRSLNRLHQRNLVRRLQLVDARALAFAEQDQQLVRLGLGQDEDALHGFVETDRAPRAKRDLRGAGLLDGFHHQLAFAGLEQNEVRQRAAELAEDIVEPAGRDHAAYRL